MIRSAVRPQNDQPGQKERSRRIREAISVVLVVLASLATVVGGAALYGREEIVNTDAFVDRATDALQEPAIKQVVSREITVQLIEPALPDVVAARPLIQSAVGQAIASGPFRALFRLGVRHGQRLLFDRGSNGVFDIADAGTVITSSLRTLAPNIANQIPSKTDSILATIRRRSFAGTTLLVADSIRVLGIVLPLAAVGLFALAIAISPVRRVATTRSGVGLGTAAILLAISLEIVRRYAVAHVTGANELSTSAAQGAVNDVWGAYIDDLLTWSLAVAAGAYLLAASSSSVLRPYSATEALRRARDLSLGPRSRRARAIQGVLALAIGLFAVLKPTLSLRVVAVVAGCLLIYFGLGEVLTVTAPAVPRLRRQWRASSRRLVAFGSLGAALAAGLIVVFVLAGAARSQASSGGTCNGYAQLCSRRLDEVAFPGTHNSMSAADAGAWFIANQDRGIAEQLRGGIRAFKISTHYGIEGQTGLVQTDLAAEGERPNRVAEKLVPAAREALQRFSRSLGRIRNGAGQRDIWLCHTLCELGATRMVTFFETIRNFLEANPNQVLVFFDEDYVQERDLQDAFKRAGVFRYLAVLQPGQPPPTLGQLIRNRHNIVVFAQERTTGKYPWDAYAFSNWIQDTPLGAQKKTQFRCTPYRGQPSNPILMMNNWADIFPPRPTPNIPLVQKDFILQRARQCDEQRGHLPNLILTDYYNRGDVVGAAATLNGVERQRPATIAPFEPAS